MTLDGVLAQATSGLDAITKQLSTLSQNVGNARTPGYVRESTALSSATADGQGDGVRAGVAARTLDTALQAGLFATGGSVAAGQTTQAALQAVDTASGAPGSGQDLASLVGALRDAYSTLGNDPSNATQQRAVVNAASALARGINGLGQAVSSERQSAQDSLGDDVSSANAALDTVGQVSLQIIAARSRGQSTADLEDRRDAAERTAAELTGAAFLPQPNGDVLAVSGGTVLPTRASSGPLLLANATLAPGTPPAAVPPLLVDGSVAPITGGQIGAKLALRDKTLPALQASLDKFAQSLATGFTTAGLTLFTDASGLAPPPGTAGFAQSIQANPVVTASPNLVRDGTAGPTTAGTTALVSSVLGSVLATGAGTVAAQASDFTTQVGLQLSSVSSQLTTDTAVQTSLNAKLTAGTGVSVDTELSSMVALQNSYGANAKVVTAVQSMWTQLLASVVP